MILIGDALVPYESLVTVFNINAIAFTKANSTVLFSYHEKLMQYCYENKLLYAVKVTSLKEAIYANALDARYIICETPEAKKVQKVAQNYLFDSKILAIISSNDELEDIAHDEIDGVIYQHMLRELV